jgi:hypothetical protein
MKIPTITGTIDRRILINYRVDAGAIRDYLPAPFRPLLVNGYGIAGICLIRLKQIRPKGLPESIGISSENGAHRIAVEWPSEGKTQQGVYIPRRDTSSRLNSLAGGCIFPGAHHLAKFIVKEEKGLYDVSYQSDDGTSLSIRATESTHLNPDSIFGDINAASCFLEKGSLGYSPDQAGKEFEGLELNTKEWKVSPLDVSHVQSSFFEDTLIFPEGSVTFDNALLMTDIEHEWISKPALDVS